MMHRVFRSTGQPRPSAALTRSLLAIALGSMYFLLANCHSPSDDNNNPQPHTQNVVNATITVQPGSWDYYTVTTTSSMSSPSLSGSFTASGGSGNDIYVYVMDATDYVNWSNGHQVTPLYNSGKVTTANFNVSLGSSGTYYLVYDNTFSTFSSKNVATDVNLEYEE